MIRAGKAIFILSPPPALAVYDREGVLNRFLRAGIIIVFVYSSLDARLLIAVGVLTFSVMSVTIKEYIIFMILRYKKITARHRGQTIG